MKIVIDTNVFVGALQRGDGVNRKILELCFLDELEPLMGDALYFEYEDLMMRGHLYIDTALSEEERSYFFDDFCSICSWINIYYRWRPNLKDEGDNHLLEMAISGQADAVLTWNKKDFKRSDLVLPDIQIVTPVEFLTQRRERR